MERVVAMLSWAWPTEIFFFLMAFRVSSLGKTDPFFPANLMSGNVGQFTGEGLYRPICASLAACLVYALELHGTSSRTRGAQVMM